MKRQQQVGFWLSIILTLVVAGISLAGVLSPHFYSRETPNWQIQSVGQDFIDLFLAAPALLITTLLTRNQKRVGTLLQGGVLLYLLYTFTIYCFDVHFNSLFPLYCMALGMSFYLFLNFLLTVIRDAATIKVKPVIQWIVSIYFMIIAVLFYLLWLAEVIPHALTNQPPTSLLDVGLPTNPVHVLDLSVILPGIFITGVLLLKNKKTGHVMTPVLLVFFILMDITIGALSYIMQQHGLPGSFTLTIAMGLLALVSTGLLIWYLKNQNTESVSST